MKALKTRLEMNFLKRSVGMILKAQVTMHQKAVPEKIPANSGDFGMAFSSLKYKLIQQIIPLKKII